MTLILKPLPSRVGFFQTAAGGGAGGKFFELLGRNEATGTTDSLDTGTIEARDNLMFMGYKISSGNADFVYRVNADSGSNYAFRWSNNGAADGSATPATRMLGDSGGSTVPSFQVGFISNIATQEKLLINYSVGQNTAGAANPPIRRESVSIWNNTSDAITSVQGTNVESGSMAAGSEMVVLGYNNSTDSGGDTWEEIANNDETSGDNTATFTAKKYLLVEFFAENSGTIQPELIMGSGGSIDTGSNFASRGSINGAADWTKASEDSIEVNDSTGNPIFCQFFICNISDEEKLAIGHYNWRYTAGAGTSPGIIQVVGKWANTSAQCDILGFKNAGAGSFGASNLRIWGFD